MGLQAPDGILSNAMCAFVAGISEDEGRPPSTHRLYSQGVDAQTGEVLGAASAKTVTAVEGAAGAGVRKRHAEAGGQLYDRSNGGGLGYSGSGC